MELALDVLIFFFRLMASQELDVTLHGTDALIFFFRLVSLDLRL